MAHKYFKMTGSGEFPFDMLRYDHCWPESIVDADMMRGEDIRLRTIVLLTDNANAPTKRRWESFTWKVED